MAALNDKYPGLGDEIFPIKLSEVMRSIVEASTHMFEDAAALDTRIEERQCSAAAALETGLDQSVVKALLRPPRDTTSWTLVEDITFLELISACVNEVKHIYPTPLLSL